VVPQVTAGKAKKNNQMWEITSFFPSLYLFFSLSVLSRVTVTCKQRNSQHKAINFVFHLFSKFDIFCFNLFFFFIGGWVTVLLQEKTFILVSVVYEHCLRWWLGGATIAQGGDGCYVL
jgi:hypothetical protein